MLEPEPAVLDAVEFLATYREGVLFADGTPMARRFVSDPASGRLLIPVSPEVTDAAEHVLHVPEESDDAMALMVSVTMVHPDTLAACDRYLAYHGAAEEARWIACQIEAAKWGGVVLDGALLQRANPLAGAMRSHRNLDIPAALCVGVDPGGLHVRSRFGVVRVRFARAAATETEAVAAIEHFLS